MAQKKYYAVRRGRETGIFTSWAECKKQIDGFSGATYKSFPDLHAAEVYMGQAPAAEVKAAMDNSAEAVAYVDGSYKHETKEYSYGMVFFYNNTEEHFAEKYADETLAAMRNVAGEIAGAQKAMEKCLALGIRTLDLYYDYEGIEKWCTGDWKTNKTGTAAYKKYYDSIKSKLKVRFVKVSGHSGDKYNDLADKLAKGALGIKG